MSNAIKSFHAQPPTSATRYELAASFFILSGSIKDAVGVLAHELGDPQLALWVARLLEGPGGPVASDLISQVREAGWCNRWAVANMILLFNVGLK